MKEVSGFARRWLGPLSAGLACFVVYCLTAFRTITWWDSARYSLAAITLGVAPPPGSLILTLLGWGMAHLPVVPGVAFRLNLLSAVLAAGTVILLAHLSTRAVRRYERASLPLLTGGAVGGLVLGFCPTLWDLARHLNPYVLTGFFTTLILAALYVWWERAEKELAAGWLFVIFLLMGLDLSVHRTNLLLLPGVLLWVGLRRPRAYGSPKCWLGTLAGLVVGLSFHLLLIPLAGRDPFLNFGDPSSLSRFWDYLSLKQYGGGWLVNLFPRTAPFWRVQVGQYWEMFSTNFAGGGSPLAWFPVAFGIVGVARHLASDWKQGLGFAALFLLASLGAVFYFNTPPDYFRPVDRHYLPSFILFAFWIGAGISAVLSLASMLNGWRRPAARASIIAIALLVPIGELWRGFPLLDGSRNYFAEDYSRNLLATVPPGGMLLTNGDNDTFPLWYLQIAHGCRKDVTILNVNLLNMPPAVRQLLRRDRDLPLRLSEKQIDSMGAIPGADTTLHIPLPRGIGFGLPDGVQVPDTLFLEASPGSGGRMWLPQDILLFNILVTNEWRRPLCVSITMNPRNLSWLQPYHRLEGLAWRVVPVVGQPINEGIMRENLLRTYTYRGFADPAVSIDETTRMMGRNYLMAFLTLAQTERGSGNEDGARKTLSFMEKMVPPGRLGADLRN